MKSTSPYLTKFRYLFLPFLLIATLFVLIYSFLHRLLVIRMELEVKEELIEFWLPMLLVWIPIFVWLRPRIKRIQFKNENGAFGYQMFAGLIIAVVTMFAQGYVSKMSAEHKVFDRVVSIPENDKSRYYTINQYVVDKSVPAVFSKAEVSGKYNDDLVFTIYLAMPIQSALPDSGSKDAKYWLAKWYTKKIDNNLSDTEKDDAYKSFAQDIQAQFDTTSFGDYSYLERLGNNAHRDALREALKVAGVKDGDLKILLTGSDTPLQPRNGKTLSIFLISLGIGSLIWLVMILIPTLNLEHSSEGHAQGSNTETLKEGLSFILPREGFFITPWLMIVNIIVFLIMVVMGMGFISFSGEDLVALGGNYGPLTKDGQWWRLLTNIFLHGGIMHIAANMYGLAFVGLFLEPILGRWRYLLVYLITGILASLVSLWWNDAVVSIGASGAIFGLYGFFLAAIVWKVFPSEFGKAFLSSTLVFVGYNLLMGLRGGIDNAAHIGGLISGFVIGTLMARGLKTKMPTVESGHTDDEHIS